MEMARIDRDARVGIVEQALPGAAGEAEMIWSRNARIVEHDMPVIALRDCGSRQCQADRGQT